MFGWSSGEWEFIGLKRTMVRMSFLFSSNFRRIPPVALALLLASQSHLKAAGTDGANFLDIPVGARPAAMGSGYSALATDAYAPIWNPAGLGRTIGTSFAGQHLSYLESIHYEYLGVVHSIKEGTGLGLSAQYLGT